MKKETKEIKNIKEELHNEICKSCLKFKEFGKSCWVYWEGKKECTMRVKEMEEWEKENLLMGK